MSKTRFPTDDQFLDHIKIGSDTQSSSENLKTLKAFRKRKIGVKTVSKPCHQNGELVLNHKQVTNLIFIKSYNFKISGNFLQLSLQPQSVQILEGGI